MGGQVKEAGRWNLEVKIFRIVAKTVPHRNVCVARDVDDASDRQGRHLLPREQFLPEVFIQVEVTWLCALVSLCAPYISAKILFLMYFHFTN